MRPRYQWMYLYGEVSPKSGKTSWLLMPTVTTPVFALASFCLRTGTGRWAKQTDSPGSPIRLAGTRVVISWFPKGFICSFYHHIRPSCSPQNAGGLSPMSRLPIGSESSRGSSCKTFKQSAATGFKLILTSCVGGPPFIGGLLEALLHRRRPVQCSSGQASRAFSSRSMAAPSCYQSMSFHRVFISLPPERYAEAN